MKNVNDQNPITLLFNEVVYKYAYGSDMGTRQLTSLIKRGKVSHHFQISTANSKLLTPTVNLVTGVTTFHESHLSYLWCVIHSFISLIEFTIEKMSGLQTFLVMTDAPELKKANSLMTWAFSLKNSHSNWPSHLPSPNARSEKCKLANSLFVKAALYMMYHELGHLSNCHDQYLSLVSKAKENELTLDESLILKQMEVEADNFAFECLTTNEKNEAETFTSLVASSIAVISNLYLISNTIELISYTHPDMDTRIFNLMNKIHFENTEYKFWIEQIYNVGLSLFINQLPRAYLREDLSFGSFEEILNYLYSCLDVEKSNLPSLKYENGN